MLAIERTDVHSSRQDPQENIEPFSRVPHLVSQQQTYGSRIRI